MTTFAYKGYDSSGKIQKGLTEASDLKQAREKLAEAGILTELIEPAGLAPPSRRAWPARDFSIFVRTKFYQELLALVRAGLPIVKALDMLIQSPETGNTALLLASARDRIKEGSSLADALAAASTSISAYEKGAISAGERAGMLDVTLERLASFLEEQSRLQDSVITALIYPALVLIVAAGIAVGLLGFAVPRIGQLLQEEAGLALPLLTRFMIGLGNFTARWGLLLLAVAAVAALAGWRRVTRDPELVAGIDRMKFRLPFIGRGYALLVNLRFARTLSMLLRGDVPLIEAMRLSGEATGSAWAKDMLAAEAEQVKHGSTLADALRRIPPLAAHIAEWAQVGEAGGRLPELLESAGDRLEQQWTRFVSRSMALLEPALIVVISAFVLVVVLSVLLPIMSLNVSLL